MDCRKPIAYPRVRRRLTALALAKLEMAVGLEAFDAVAGGETAGIAYAAFLAEGLDLPMHYVRKAPKGFGRGAQIEGDLREGARVLLVEDLATDGGSKRVFVKALREAGATVEHCLVLFHHDVFRDRPDRLQGLGLTLHSLARWADVMAAGRDTFPAADLAEVEAFLADPYAWSGARGGLARPPEA